MNRMKLKEQTSEGDENSQPIYNVKGRKNY